MATALLRRVPPDAAAAVLRRSGAAPAIGCLHETTFLYFSFVGVIAEGPGITTGQRLLAPPPVIEVTQRDLLRDGACLSLTEALTVESEWEGICHRTEWRLSCDGFAADWVTTEALNAVGDPSAGEALSRQVAAVLGWRMP